MPRRTKVALAAYALVAAAIVAAVIFADHESIIPEGTGRSILAVAMIAKLYPIGFVLFRFVASYELESPPIRRAWPAGEEEYRDPDR